MRDLSWVPRDFEMSVYEALTVLCVIEDNMVKRGNVVLNANNLSYLIDKIIDRVERYMINSDACPKINFDEIFNGEIT